MFQTIINVLAVIGTLCMTVLVAGFVAGVRSKIVQRSLPPADLPGVPDVREQQSVFSVYFGDEDEDAA